MRHLQSKTKSMRMSESDSSTSFSIRVKRVKDNGTERVEFESFDSD